MADALRDGEIISWLKTPQVLLMRNSEVIHFILPRRNNLISYQYFVASSNITSRIEVE